MLAVSPCSIISISQEKLPVTVRFVLDYVTTCSNYFGVHLKHENTNSTNSPLNEQIYHSVKPERQVCTELIIRICYLTFLKQYTTKLSVIMIIVVSVIKIFIVCWQNIDYWRLFYHKK